MEMTRNWELSESHEICQKENKEQVSQTWERTKELLTIEYSSVA